MNGVILLEATTGAVILSRAFQHGFGIPDLIRTDADEGGGMLSDEEMVGMQVSGLLTAMKLKCKAAFAEAYSVQSFSGGGVRVVMKSFADSSLLCVVVAEELIEEDVVAAFATSLGTMFLEKHKDVVEGAANGRIKKVKKSVKKMTAQCAWDTVDDLYHDLCTCLLLICSAPWVVCFYSPELSLGIADPDAAVDYAQAAAVNVAAAAASDISPPPAASLARLVHKIGRMQDLYFSDAPQLLEMQEGRGSRFLCIVIGDLFICFHDPGKSGFNASFLHQLLSNPTTDALYAMLRFVYAHEVKPATPRSPMIHHIPEYTGSRPTSRDCPAEPTSSSGQQRLAGAGRPSSDSLGSRPASSSARIHGEAAPLDRPASRDPSISNQSAASTDALKSGRRRSGR
eukprot:TRINITY_DN9635_c0_g1_i2.p1 TRINITY_DN9635_c0_g1~~TRINITY_DN9635_c0_g1_i2.p1  ORF type:complete len:398 (+),score=118.97 TRINITY_DN9635_c0_g1_i2:111-1304(+)